MLPSRFEYHRAGSLDEAFALLDQYGEDAKVLAGGQSLIPMMKLRFANPDHLIDVNHVAGLDGIEETDGDAAHRRTGAPQPAGRLRRHQQAIPRSRAPRHRSPTPSCGTSARSAAPSPTPTPPATPAR